MGRSSPCNGQGAWPADHTRQRGGVWRGEGCDQSRHCHGRVASSVGCDDLEVVASSIREIGCRVGGGRGRAGDRGQRGVSAAIGRDEDEIAAHGCPVRCGGGPSETHLGVPHRCGQATDRTRNAERGCADRSRGCTRAETRKGSDPVLIQSPIRQAHCQVARQSALGVGHHRGPRRCRGTRCSTGFNLVAGDRRRGRRRCLRPGDQNRGVLGGCHQDRGDGRSQRGGGHGCTG